MAILAGVAVVAVIWQYSISRGPASDQQKTQDIISLQSEVQSYATNKNEAPKSLEVLNLSGGLKDRLNDYTYVLNDDSYDICATFKTDTSIESGASYDSSPYYHKTGKVCFTDQLYLNDSTDYDYFNNYDYNLNQ